MTTQEFSNTFDTLLNSYNTQAPFGEQTSAREVVLDEYEKSVLLTQAQDIIVKSYFDGSLNPQGQGMDDSSRRQIDFSNLIKVTSLYPLPNNKSNSAIFALNDGEGNFVDNVKVTYNYKGRGTIPTGDYVTFILYISTEKTEATVEYEEEDNSLTVEVYIKTDDETFLRGDQDDKRDYLLSLPITNTSLGGVVRDYIDITFLEDKNASYTMEPWYENTTLVRRVLYKSSYPASALFDDRGILYQMPKKADGKSTDVLFILNEKLTQVTTTSYKNKDLPTIEQKKDYVIVPISYREYDREMSKPYAQPLKKQAWRLFQNQATGFDANVELIPRFNVVEGTTENASGETTSKVFIYKIRYVKRPQPIVLEDLPNGLEIDGVFKETPCELNPILHMDILNKAVELAIATRGGSQQPTSNNQPTR